MITEESLSIPSISVRISNYSLILFKPGLNNLFQFKSSKSELDFFVEIETRSKKTP
jgi:hypothetical protein